MKILKLRASFGTLHGELTLQDGLNRLCLPNEAGKSTWSAFLLAMLYGIDTSERASAANQGLPAKERYRPWDGSPMEGSMELLWQGRHITLERTTRGRVPMGVFRAYETDSGLPVPELTAENCGRLLCGVERSVFERTAFIRQLGLPVSGDAALEKRLGALVTTGEDGGKSYSELEKSLRTLKNRLSGRAGRIPRLQERLDAVEAALDELHGLQERAMALAAQLDAATRENDRLTALQARIARAQAAKKQAALNELNEKLAAQEALCRRLEEAVAALPGEDALQAFRRTLDGAEAALQTAQLEAAFSAPAAEAPPAPPYFAGLTAEEARKKAEANRREYLALSERQERRALPAILLCLLLMLAGGGLCFLLLPAGLAVAAVGAVALPIWLLLLRRRNARVREAHEQAGQILARYGVTDCELLPTLAARYAATLEAYAAGRHHAAEQTQALQDALAAAQAQADAVLQKAASFAPDCKTLPDCREAVSAGLRTHERLSTERRALEGMRKQYDAVKTICDGAAEAAEDAEALQLDAAKIDYEQRHAAQALSALATRAAALQGAISARGDAVALEAEAERLRESLREAQMQSEAVDLALDALQAADAALRSRFSPQITAEAGKILAALTGDKYPTVLLEPDLRLSVRESEGSVMRPAAAMSCGTADQMYLALRLAMCRRLLPEDTPLVLDDALVNFDRERAAAALALLEKEAKKRQVIFFTCREL